MIGENGEPNFFCMHALLSGDFVQLEYQLLTGRLKVTERQLGSFAKASARWRLRRRANSTLAHVVRILARQWWTLSDSGQRSVRSTFGLKRYMLNRLSSGDTFRAARGMRKKEQGPLLPATAYEAFLSSSNGLPQRGQWSPTRGSSPRYSSNAL